MGDSGFTAGDPFRAPQDDGVLTYRQLRRLFVESGTMDERDALRMDRALSRLSGTEQFRLDGR
jgi:hypothetical protein